MILPYRLVIAFFAMHLFHYSLIAQIKHDNLWLFGHPSIDGDTLYGGTILRFDTISLSVTYFNIPIDFSASATISDKKGRLQFYTNNCKIINREHRTMKNGDDLNVGGYTHWNNCQKGNGYSTHQGALILPWPERPNEYLHFHLHKGNEDNLLINGFLYSVVDMREDNGLGAVTAKNQVAWRDTFLSLTRF